MDAKGDEIKRVQDLLVLIENSKLAEKQNAHVRLWFRGQSKAGWPGSPGVYRSKLAQKTEDERLRIERHLTQDFRIECASLLPGSKDDAELYFLQQHYRMPTRLLDWTNNPLAGLYFAVTREPDEDAELFMMDAYMLAPCQNAAKQFQGVMTRRNQIFQNALQVIFNWWKPEDNFPKFVFPVRPDHFDQRIVLQKGCFTFHVPGRDCLTKSINSSLRCFRIPKDSKPVIQKELFLLGIDIFSVYGDLESLSERLKFAYGVR